MSPQVLCLLLQMFNHNVNQHTNTKWGKPMLITNRLSRLFITTCNKNKLNCNKYLSFSMLGFQHADFRKQYCLTSILTTVGPLITSLLRTGPRPEKDFAG